LVLNLVGGKVEQKAEMTAALMAHLMAGKKVFLLGN
jgi:hypothetical protein